MTFKKIGALFWGAPLFFEWIFAQPNSTGREDTVYVMVGEVFEYVVPKDAYDKDESFVIEEIDEKALRDLTSPELFQRDKIYRFLALSPGRTRIVVDKIDTSGGKKGFLIIHVVVRETPKPREQTDEESESEIKPPEALEQERVRGEPDARRPGTTSPQTSQSKKEHTPEFNKLRSGYKMKDYKIRREAFVKELDDFIKNPLTSPKEAMQTKFMKAKVLGELSKTNKEETIKLLEEITNTALLPGENDGESQSVKRQAYYDLYLAELSAGRDEKAKQYLDRVIAMTDEASPYYSYFLYKMGSLNKREKDYDAAYAQLKYVYQLMTGNEEISIFHGGQGRDESSGEVYMFRGQRYEDLTADQKEELLSLFHGDKNFMDEVFFQLAEIYELSKENRDYAKAKKLYEDLLANFPRSELAKLAKLKIFYLNNNFIKPR